MECYSFNIIFDYMKMGKFLLQCILFVQKMILNRATRPFHTKIDELRILLSLGLLSGGFEIYLRFFYFGVENMLCPNKRDCPLNSLYFFSLIFCYVFVLKHMFKSTCFNRMAKRFKHACILCIMLF